MTRRGGRVKTEEDPFEIPGLRISELSQWAVDRTR